MATWDDLKNDVYVWTNRPTLIAETELALRQAIRTAHRMGKFWRDIVTTQVVPATMDAIQQIDLETACPNFKQICYVKSGGRDFYYDEASPQMLLDVEYGYPKTGVYWGMGALLNIRAEAPEELYEIAYFRQPATTPPESIDDWLLATYKDVVVLLAAGTILGIIGEQEIKGRVDGLLALEIAGLQQEQIEVTGR